MLVLSRNEKDSILITVPTSTGNVEIEIVVHRLERNRVKIGVVAPADVFVLRKELKGRNAENA